MLAINTVGVNDFGGDVTAGPVFLCRETDSSLNPGGKEVGTNEAATARNPRTPVAALSR